MSEYEVVASTPSNPTRLTRSRSDAFSSSSSNCSDQLDNKRFRFDSTNMEESAVENCIATLESKLDDKLKEIKKEFLTTLKQQFDVMRSEILSLKESNSSLLKEVEILREGVRSAKEHAIRNEQYSRRSDVRIFGVSETTGEDSKQVVVDLLRSKLGLPAEKCHLIAAHRLPNGSRDKLPNKAYPIIVRFASRDLRDEVLQKKKKLGKGTYINEDLCRDVQAIFSRVRSDPRVERCWTRNGSVFVKRKDIEGRIHVPYGVSLNDLFKQ